MTNQNDACMFYCNMSASRTNILKEMATDELIFFFSLDIDKTTSQQHMSDKDNRKAVKAKSPYSRKAVKANSPYIP